MAANKEFDKFQRNMVDLAYSVNAYQSDNENRDFRNTIFESIGEGDQGVFDMARSAISQYMTMYGESPTINQLASAGQAIQTVLEGKVGQEVNSGQLILEDTTTSDIPVRNIFLGMILPSVLLSISGRLTTPFPASPDFAEIYRLFVKADSNWNGYNVGDILDEGFSGGYGNMDLMASIGTGNGTLTTFSATMGHELRPDHVRILIDRDTVGQDDGNGNIVGTWMNGSTAVAVTGTVNYATGAITVNTASAVTSGLLVETLYDVDIETNPSLIPKIKYDIVKYTVKPHESVLNSQYSLQSMLNLDRNYNQNMGSLSNRHLLNLITTNVDRVTVDRMYQFAKGSKTFDTTIPTALTNVQHFQTISVLLDEVSNELMDRTRQAGLFAIVCGDKMARLFKTLGQNGQFQFRENYRESPQPQFIGKFNGQYEIYRAPNLPSDEAIAVAKGDDYFQTGFYTGIAVPYMPFKHSVQEDLRYKTTLYGKQYRDISPVDGRNYFMKLQLTGTGL